MLTDVLALSLASLNSSVTFLQCWNLGNIFIEKASLNFSTYLLSSTGLVSVQDNNFLEKSCAHWKARAVNGETFHQKLGRAELFCTSQVIVSSVTIQSRAASSEGERRRKQPKHKQKQHRRSRAHNETQHENAQKWHPWGSKSFEKRSEQSNPSLGTCVSLSSHY